MDLILPNIKSPNDIKNMSDVKLDQLAREIRIKLVSVVSENGGHLASNLGVVELTIALHKVFDCPADTIIFDVGHQSYVHKMLTGRLERMDTLRKKGGLSGFPCVNESEYDPMTSGHASTSISNALGMLRAKRLMGDDSYVVAVVGDGSMTGGMVYEALDDAAQSKLPLIVVINDNDMSISKNVGGLNQHLTNMRLSSGYRSFKLSILKALDKMPGHGKKLSTHMESFKNRIKSFLMPNMFYEAFGHIYLGPTDGHDIPQMCEIFEKAKDLTKPVVIHVVTQKGKGYTPAQENPEKFHGIGAFDIETGLEKCNKSGIESNSDVFGKTICELAETDKRIVAITAAMPNGTGLTTFASKYPERFFDVGIAEEHAVAMAAGMAAKGSRPIVAIYSTFLQRAYDQIIHDVCLTERPVVLAIDRAGLVGADGETHQGAYDIAYLLTIPNIVIMSPATVSELRCMLKIAVKLDRPVAIRYSKSLLPQLTLYNIVQFGKWEEYERLTDVNIVVTGRLLEYAIKAARELNVGIVNARFIRPMDEHMLDRLKMRSKAIITLEEGIASSGMGMRITAYMNGSDIKVKCLGLPDKALLHASIAEQEHIAGITPQQIRRVLAEIISEVRG